MPYRDPNAGATRRTICHSRHDRCSSGGPVTPGGSLIAASRGTLLASASPAVGAWACGGALSRSAPPPTKPARAVLVSARGKSHAGVRGKGNRLRWGGGRNMSCRYGKAPPTPYAAPAAKKFPKIVIAAPVGVGSRRPVCKGVAGCRFRWCPSTTTGPGAGSAAGEGCGRSGRRRLLVCCRKGFHRDPG